MSIITLYLVSARDDHPDDPTFARVVTGDRSRAHELLKAVVDAGAKGSLQNVGIGEDAEAAFLTALEDATA